MKLTLATFDIIVSLPSDSRRCVKVGEAFWIKPKGDPNLFPHRWRENWSVAVIENLTATPKELFHLLECTGHKIINTVYVTRGEFVTALNEVGYQIDWCAKEVLWLKPIDLRDAWKSVPHTQS